MKILLVNNNPKGKGTFWRCFGLAKYLSRAGYEVSLICLQNQKSLSFSTEVKDGVKMIFLPCLFNWGIKELPGHLLRAVWIVFFVLKGNFDVVHAFNVAFPTTGLPVFPLWFFKKLGWKKYKIIVDWDDLWGKGGLTDWKEMGKLVISAADFLETKVPLLADRVTLVSEELKRRAIMTGVEPKKITRVINGADAEAIKPMNKFEARKRLNLKIKDKIICYAAASVTMNYQFILSSFEKVTQKVKGVKLVVLSPLKKFEEKVLLESKAGDRILMVGFKPYEDYLLYLAASDVLLLPRSSHVLDRCEFPSRLGDFMASARPVVISQAGDAWKIIEESQAGLVARVDDPSDFSQKIIQILENPILAKKMAQNGRRAAEDNFSWEKLSQCLLRDVYEKN